MDWRSVVGRHRRLDPDPTPHRWVVCNALGEGADAPSNLRRCGGNTNRGCGRQVWVSLRMDALVEAGELTPRCWDCQARATGLVTIHDTEIKALRAAGALDRGWAFIAEANAWLHYRRSADANGDPQTG